MTGNQYQKLSARTINQKHDKDINFLHGVFGLASEAGEVSGILQKSFQGHEINTDDLINELGDCLWMIAEICTCKDIDLDTVMMRNIDKLIDRYPDGFDEQRSKERYI